MILTADQSQALGEIVGAVQPGRHHLLTGYAGSGKTTLMQHFVREMLGARKSVVLTAPTHKAVSVLSRKLREAGIDGVECRTLHSLLSLKPKPHSDRMIYVCDKRAEPVMEDVVVIDECSMVSEDMMVHVKRHLPVSFVLFVGDPAQLPPVGEVASETFKTSGRSHLDTIVRQAAGNPVLEAAHTIRTSQGGPMDWSWCKPAHVKPCGVYLPADADGWMRKAFTSADFDNDPDRFRYLAWTNERVGQVNRRVRTWRYGDQAHALPFVPGERALVKQPVIKDGTILFNTNEEAEVLAIGQGEFSFAIDRAEGVEGWDASLPSWEIELQRADGSPQLVHMIADQRAYNAIVARITDEATECRARWGHLHAFKSALANLQAIYAMTVHTSQGSTFQNVFVDLADIRRRAISNFLETQQLLYVAATRPSLALILVGAAL